MLAGLSAAATVTVLIFCLIWWLEDLWVATVSIGLTIASIAVIWVIVSVWFWIFGVTS